MKVEAQHMDRELAQLNAEVEALSRDDQKDEAGGAQAAYSAEIARLEQELRRQRDRQELLREEHEVRRQEMELIRKRRALERERVVERLRVERAERDRALRTYSQERRTRQRQARIRRGELSPQLDRLRELLRQLGDNDDARQELSKLEVTLQKLLEEGARQDEHPAPE